VEGMACVAVAAAGDHAARVSVVKTVFSDPALACTLAGLEDVRQVVGVGVGCSTGVVDLAVEDDEVQLAYRVQPGSCALVERACKHTRFDFGELDLLAADEKDQGWCSTDVRYLRHCSLNLGGRSSALVEYVVSEDMGRHWQLVETPFSCNWMGSASVVASYVHEAYDLRVVVSPYHLHRLHPFHHH